MNESLYYHCARHVIVFDTYTSRQRIGGGGEGNEIIITVSKRISVQLCVCIHSSLTRNFPDMWLRYFWQKGMRHSRLKRFFRNFSNSLDYHTEHRSLENCVRQERVNINCGTSSQISAIEFLFLSPVKVCRRAWRLTECLKCCAFIERGRGHNTGHEIDCDPSIWIVFKFIRAFAQVVIERQCRSDW